MAWPLLTPAEWKAAKAEAGVADADRDIGPEPVAPLLRGEAAFTVPGARLLDRMLLKRRARLAAAGSA